jgi:hypothetical protein
VFAVTGGYVSGDDVKGSESRDAQQFPPAGATTAHAAANGIGQEGKGHGEIRWVGEQHRMAGYCGRAVVAGRATVSPAGPGDGRAEQDRPRPVALLQRPRGLVVRIGPRPAACEPEHAKAA